MRKFEVAARATRRRVGDESSFRPSPAEACGPTGFSPRSTAILYRVLLEKEPWTVI